MKRSIRTLATAVVLAIAGAGIAAAGSSPAVSTGSVSQIKDTSATLGGTINPEGSSTSYQFAYGLTKAYGTLTKVKSAGSGSKAAVKTAGIGDLTPGTTYHYKLLATNKFGVTAGNDHTFKTAGFAPPQAITGAPTGIERFAATLTGVVNPHGAATSWTFQYGLTTNYGYQTAGGVLVPSNAADTVTATLTGIEPGVLFHYRLIALHGTSVISAGNDETFYTLPSPAPVPKIKASTTPHTAKHSPYVLVTRATVTGPSSIPDATACFGNAAITYYVGKRQVSSTFAPLLTNCTLSATTTFNHLPVRLKHHAKRETLTIRVHYRGDGYLAPVNARVEKVTLG